MKKISALITVILVSAAAAVVIPKGSVDIEDNMSVPEKTPEYIYPEFYKGFYLTSRSGRDSERLAGFLDEAAVSGLNTVVVDVQDARKRPALTPPENVRMIKEKGFHPVARVVIFPLGLKEYPVPDDIIEERLTLAEAACEAGYREIQLDYIRFSDHGEVKHVPLERRYEVVDEIISAFRERLAKYDVKIGADVFGRIPLNNNDSIGQRMERLDGAVDFILPMAYPSHYTWSDKMMNDPYYTVHLTSVRADERTKRSEIVTWIQAFQIRVGRTGLSYEQYLEEQIRAVHDSGVRGYLMWNKSENYAVPFIVTRRFYDNTSK